MELESLIRSYVDQAHTMQLATSVDDQPWSCSVYYVADERFNLYWASLPTRRHSREIEVNGRVAAAITLETAVDKPVVGLSIEGTAALVERPADIKPIAIRYGQRFDRDQQWVRDFSAGRTQHKLYKLVPRSIVLFDEQNFAGDPRQEWRPPSR